MSNSMLNLIFPFGENATDKNKKLEKSSHSSEIRAEQIDLSGIKLRVFRGTEKTTHDTQDDVVLKTSQSIDNPGNKNSVGRFCVLVSCQSSSHEDGHRRNLIFQCALTVATQNNQGSKTTSEKQTVTIIAPKKWEELPSVFVHGMEITPDVVEKIMINNRIKFVHPKTYEELITYMTALPSSNEIAQNMFILEDIEYYLNTNEEQFMRDASNRESSSKEKLDATYTSMHLNDTVAPQRDLYLPRLTKVFSVIQNLLSTENKKFIANHSADVDDLLNEDSMRIPRCRFLANYTPSLAHAMNREQLLKLYIWADEVWIFSKESPKSTLGDHKTSNLSLASRKKLCLSYTFLDINSYDTKCDFYHDLTKNYYVMKSLTKMKI